MSYDHRPDDNDPVSTFEDLDAFEEPADRQKAARRVYTREAIIGVGLLLILAVLAVAQWRDAQFKEDQYSNGNRAASAGNWLGARDAFSSIPGFQDADLRAADAGRMITYTLALSGSVALRENAGQEGLYYNGAGGWHNLRRSDKESVVH